VRNNDKYKRRWLGGREESVGSRHEFDGPIFRREIIDCVLRSISLIEICLEKILSKLEDEAENADENAYIIDFVYLEGVGTCKTNLKMLKKGLKGYKDLVKMYALEGYLEQQRLEVSEHKEDGKESQDRLSSYSQHKISIFNSIDGLSEQSHDECVDQFQQLQRTFNDRVISCRSKDFERAKDIFGEEIDILKYDEIIDNLITK